MTSRDDQPRRASLFWLLAALTLAGLLLRSLRLETPPLWWDEGYSVYFATEPLARMVWLTARDIHPPLYYALLHGWISLWQNAAPATDRWLSVLFGVMALPALYWVGITLYPTRRAVAVMATLLLALNPLHLYYSQEIRMYGLALLWGLLATGALWRLLAHLHQPALRARHWAPWLLAYVLCATGGLFSLYYFALLLVGHTLWALWSLRRRWRRMAIFLLADTLILLAYLPWLLYAVPQLIGYVDNKVASDADTALNLPAYLARHLSAFVGGHLSPAEFSFTNLALLVGIGSMVGLGIAAWRASRRELLGREAILDAETQRRRDAQREDEIAFDASVPLPLRASALKEDAGQPATALATFVITAAILGWLINLRLPFFPEGGERLLILILPYVLLLLADGIHRTWRFHHVGKLVLGLLLVTAAAGVAIFFTTPRSIDEDYRPIVRQVVQQGTNDDAFLAIFPWQVGYWRAYAPASDALVSGPTPVLLADAIAEWSPAMADAVDAALARGAIWFPEPLTFGSTLPGEIEAHLAQQAVNLENRWYAATRLTAWRNLDAAMPAPVAGDFGALQLLAAGVAPTAVVSANTPLAATLVWQPRAAARFNVSLRLQDDAGHVWASREYELDLTDNSGPITQTVGLITPVGLPPAAYTVAVSVQQQDGTGASTPLTLQETDQAAAAIGAVEVTQPERTQSSARLPVQFPLRQPVVQEGIELLGFAGATPQPLLAGTELAVTLFLRSTVDLLPERQLYLSLLDAQGAGVGGYEGWPLPAYPTQTWPPQAVVQLPVAFFLPGTLPTGDYRLVTGWLDPATGAKTPPVALGAVAIRQRSATFERPQPGVAIAAPTLLGSHAYLIGYDWVESTPNVLDLRLHWEVVQPLLPPHHIFVHADDAAGVTHAQQDGPPVTADGAAPTGSWQPGEYLTTVHRLALPTGEFTVRVGLYEPETGVRLPVTVASQPAGDSVILQAP